MTTRTARTIYAIPVGANSIGTPIRIGTATSITAAIAQVREGGHRVMTKGGNIGTETHSSVCGGDSDALVWAVSVWP